MNAPRIGVLKWRQAGLVLLWIGLFLAYLATVMPGLSGSLSLDETWVANSVLARSLGDCLYYNTWLQSTPPAFLLAARGLLSILRPSNTALHVLPFLLGLASLLLFARVTSRSFSFAVAYLSTAALAFSPFFLKYSDSLKQYIAEVFFCCLMLAISEAARISETKWVSVWCTLTVSSLAFGYGTLFVLAGFIVGNALSLWSARDPPSLSQGGLALPSDRARGAKHLAWCVGVTAVSVAALYILFVRPNTSPALYSYWRFQYGPLRGTYELLRTLFFYLPGVAPLLNRRIPSLLMVVAGITSILSGLRHVGYRAFLRDSRLISCVVAIAALMLSALCSLYPFEARTGLFVLPLFLYLLATSLDALRRALSALPRRAISQLLDCVCVLLGLTAGMCAFSSNTFSESGVEGFQSACRYFREAGKPGDFLYVHASAREGFKLYTRLDGQIRMRTALGDSGYTCCVPGQQWPLRIDPSRPRIDLRERLPAAFRGTVYMLHPGWLGLWTRIGQNEYEIQTDALRSLGCRETRATPPGAVMITAFDCSARP
jgi:hypothetical protein